jgi:hypothetical protein
VSASRFEFPVLDLPIYYILFERNGGCNNVFPLGKTKFWGSQLINGTHRSKLDGIVDQVREDLPNPGGISINNAAENPI